MKLMYLIDTIWNSGGMERVLITKANALSEQYGYEVIIITTHQKGRVPFFPLSPSVRHIDLNVNTHLPFTMWLYMRRLSRVVRAEKPDILISLSGKEIFHLRELPGNFIRMAEFHFSHDTYLVKGQTRKLHALEKAVGSLDCFVVLTQEDEQAWKPYARNLTQIYNPSPFSLDGPCASLNAHRIISGGRFEKQKNYRDMVLAWNIVHQRHPDWILELYGNGKYKKSIARLIKRLGLQESICLHPATREMQKEMLGASAYLMTSLYEGFPMVLVETATLGLPCVAYRCPCGPGEFIQDGIDGFTAEPGDIDAMADKICRIIEDEALRKEMGRLSRKKAEAFTEARIIPLWDALFKKLLQNAKSGSLSTGETDIDPISNSSHARTWDRWMVKTSGVVFGHLLNPLWLSRSQRRTRRGEAIQKAVLRYLDRYYDFSQPLQSTSEASDTDPSAAGGIDGTGPEKIWTIWLQGEAQMPPVVRACIRSMRENSGLKVVVLDEARLKEVITLPAYIQEKWEKGLIRPAHYADICRIELLYRYGGIWCDATDYIPAPISEELMREKFFVFLTGEKLFGAYSFIQNCFIRAQRGSYLLAAWRRAVLTYWEQENGAVDYFIHQLLFKKVVDEDPVAAQEFSHMPHLPQDPTHELWYLHGYEPWDADKVQALFAKAPFQKTEYKSSLALDPPKGSIAEHLLL